MTLQNIMTFIYFIPSCTYGDKHISSQNYTSKKNKEKSGYASHLEVESRSALKLKVGSGSASQWPRQL
jgi:hypothetical protein